ncbi:hypothetical protein DFJ73DRAFT_893408 [Zopfochytrium polystomum]|nr:hypothetical protein DFJ73DRAFT_893408 [Zopfochytrium polystomum]
MQASSLSGLSSSIRLSDDIDTSSSSSSSSSSIRSRNANSNGISSGVGNSSGSSRTRRRAAGHSSHRRGALAIATTLTDEALALSSQAVPMQILAPHEIQCTIPNPSNFQLASSPGSWPAQSPLRSGANSASPRRQVLAPSLGGAFGSGSPSSRSWRGDEMIGPSSGSSVDVAGPSNSSAGDNVDLGLEGYQQYFVDSHPGETGATSAAGGSALSMMALQYLANWDAPASATAHCFPCKR